MNMLNLISLTKYMNKKICLGLTAALAMVFFFGFSVLAATDSAAANSDELEQVKTLIKQGVSCQQLNPDQLDKIGDYYMEQMMPGQAHKNMEQTLGGDGSESLKQMHILMARRWYCGDAVGLGMMSLMTGDVNGAGMMGGGYGMIGLGSAYNWGGWLIMILTIALLIIGIIAAVKYLLKK